MHISAVRTEKFDGYQCNRVVLRECIYGLHVYNPAVLKGRKKKGERTRGRRHTVASRIRNLLLIIMLSILTRHSYPVHRSVSSAACETHLAIFVNRGIDLRSNPITQFHRFWCILLFFSFIPHSLFLFFVSHIIKGIESGPNRPFSHLTWLFVLCKICFVCFNFLVRTLVLFVLSWKKWIF